MVHIITKLFQNKHKTHNMVHTMKSWFIFMQKSAFIAMALMFKGIDMRDQNIYCFIKLIF